MNTVLRWTRSNRNNGQEAVHLFSRIMLWSKFGVEHEAAAASVSITFIKKLVKKEQKKYDKQASFPVE